MWRRLWIRVGFMVERVKDISMYIKARRGFTVKVGSKLHNKRHDMLSHTSCLFSDRGMKLLHIA